MRRIATMFGLAVICFLTVNMSAQEYRATMLGIVSDSTGAVMSGAEVVVTNTATRVVTNSKTNGDGAYVVPFLVPGPYTLRVQKSGFQSFEQTGIQLQGNAQVRINVKLSVGQAYTEVKVTSQTPLLDTAGANNGQVIDQRQLVTLPVHSLNPMEVPSLSTGVNSGGNGLLYSRPFDNGSIDAYSINGGGVAQNNYQLDGFPNNALTFYQAQPQVAFVPPIFGVQEVKVMTNTYDAQYGHTLGGIVSVITKSGTNVFHGNAYYSMHRTYLDANTYLNDQNGSRKPFDHVDQFGFEIGGPVIIPKVYHGKDRTFFMFSYEHYNDSKPLPALGSVPTPLQRTGDFSQTYNASGQLITIYDPNTTRPNPNFDSSQPVSADNPQYLRDAFEGNIIPQDRLNQVALNVMNDIPLPNSPGDPITKLNNWQAGQAVSSDLFNNYIARVDHQINGRWKIFGRWDHNRRNAASNSFDWQTPARQYFQAFRQNDGVGLDAVGVLNPQTIVTARIGYHRFVFSSDPFTSQDLSYLGLPVTNLLQESGLYPLMNFTNYIGTGDIVEDNAPSETYSADGTLIKVVGKHSLKIGVQYNIDHLADVQKQNGQGTYNFTPGFTRKTPQVSDPASGQAIASFLLGDIDNASVNLNAAPYVSWHNLGLFLQDDWQVNSRLVINLGLRWGYQSPPYVRHDAQNRGFDFNAESPVQVGGAKGGLLFAGVGQPRSAFDRDFTDWQPRLGFAYRVTPTGPLVFRGGIGRSFAPLNYVYGGNTGFSETTIAQTSTPDFKPLNTLSNPFPGGLTPAPGASLGLATNVGNGIYFTDPKWKRPYVWQYSLGFEYELTPTLLLNVSYVGSQVKHIGVYKEYDFLSTAQLGLGAGELNQVVSNPFYGVLPANTAIGGQPTIAKASLMTPYPQFTNVTDTSNSIGRSWYNSLQVKGERRFKNGFSLLAFYTYSKEIDATNYINPQDTSLSRMLGPYDARHSLVVSGTYQFPFGPGQRWLGSGMASHIIGGWEVSTTGTIHSGTPMYNPSGYYIKGNPRLSSGQSLKHWFNTSPDIWVPIPPYALSNVPQYSSDVRLPTAPQFDTSLFRTFSIWREHRLRLRLTAFNVSNTPVFGWPNTDPTSPLFGVVPPSQWNLPRSVELGAQYSF